MPEFLQRLIDRFLEWWRKFNTRQKIVIISAVAVTVTALSILGYVVSRPTQILLITAENATQAQSVKDLLDGEKITYTTSQDGMSYYINEEDEATASILLGTNNIPSEGYSLSDVIDGSFSTTEADKLKRYQLYLETRFEKQLATIDMVNSAQVTLNIPVQDGTLIAQNEDSYASIILELNSEMDDETAAGIAKYVATQLGNDNTENITIMNTSGTVLFAGGDETTAAGSANSNQSVTSKAESAVINKVKNVMLGTNVYDNVEVSPSLVLDFNRENKVDYHYYVDDGQSQGYLDSRSERTSDSTSGVAGVPGTDSNDGDTTYVIQDNDYSNSSTSEIEEDYLPSETITTTDKAVGTIQYDESSISVVATTYVVYNEDELKGSETLGDMTFDEFVQANSERVRKDVDDDFYTLVSKATGIPVANISIVSYEIPMFQYSEGSGRTLTDYIQIALAILIFLMLAYVVLRSLRKDEEYEELEEEVSVETLLEQTQQEELEDIGFTEKSEARILIEKFVDERPEAVANLLRNWLNDDWGE